MIRLITIATCVIFSQEIFSQPSCTAGPPSANDGCALAPVIALGSVYCDNTCTYTANDAAWFKASGAFCNNVSKQTVENNGFYRFQATATSINITLCAMPGCAGRNSILGVSGIQALIFNFPTANGLGTCGSGSINGYYCLKQLSGSDCGSCSNPKGCISTTVSGLTSGKFYYLMIDGYEGDCCDFRLQITSNITLPVELISFEGKANAQGNHLSWITATEQNNSHFDIESSSDAEEWVVLSSIKGYGNSQQQQNYFFLDKYPLAGMVYYRLKQVDFNGEFHFSKIITINQDYVNKVFITPNPADDVVSLKWSTENTGTYLISIVSTSGVTLFSRTEYLNQGLNDVSLSLKNLLPAGMYFLKISNSFNANLCSGKLLVR